jgi:hypothetical protein
VPADFFQPAGASGGSGRAPAPKQPETGAGPDEPQALGGFMVAAAPPRRGRGVGALLENNFD